MCLIRLAQKLKTLIGIVICLTLLIRVLDRGAKNSIKWDVLEAASLKHDYSNIGDTVKTTELAPEGDDE